MFAHLVAALAAIAFAGWLERNSDRPVRRHRWGAVAPLTIVMLGSLPLESSADSLADGTSVRVRSAAIEAGWHTGRITRDDRSCSMVQLDRPTQHGYTSLALMTVDALQLGRIGEWTAIDARRAIASEPAHCRVEGAD